MTLSGGNMYLTTLEVSGGQCMHSKKKKKFVSEFGLIFV